MKKPKTAIQPTREENYSEWYLEVIKKAELAEHSKVRGSMVIKPWGYKIWENIRKILDEKFEETGHENAYFPLFIPLSYLEKEAEHIAGFAKECAVVTHHRLEQNAEGKLIPKGKLEEPLIVRPTSEMIIGDTYAKWAKSYRDLPILINQWANVVRWEMRPRMFLRTTEFLWQEGHTVHETREEAIQETEQMLDIYVRFCEEYLAMPTIEGRKTPEERFPGAVETYTLEAMMQDKKALQAGTSHFLGQNFSKSCGIQFQARNGSLEYGWTTSWGVTTRLIGSMIMTHSDDNGLVIPPKIAPKEVVILPIIPNQDSKASVMSYVKELEQKLLAKNIRVKVDDRDLRNGEKVWSWVKKGAPIRVEIGPKESEGKTVSFFQRTKDPKNRESLSEKDFLDTLHTLLDSMQKELRNKAKAFLKDNTREIQSLDDFYQFFTPKNPDSPEIHGGFALCHLDPSLSTKKIQEDLGVTVRCIPNKVEPKEGACILSGKKTNVQAIFAKAY